jgi:hypothetical protein
MTRLESIIIDLLSVFMNCHAVSALIAFYGLPFSSKINTLRALHSIGMKPEETKNDPLMKKLIAVSQLAEFRNTIVHAYWALDSDGVPLAVRFETKGRFSRRRLPIRVPQFRDRLREAAALEKELRAIRDQMKKQKLSERYD